MTESTSPEVKASKETEVDSDYYYDSYKEFSWKFRLWVVAFGVSVPAVVLTNEKLLDRIRESSWGIAAIVLCFAGVIIQVLLTWVYKTSMWFGHQHLNKYIKKRNKHLRLSSRITHNYCIEFSVDLATLILFLTSTAILFSIVVSKHTACSCP